MNHLQRHVVYTITAEGIVLFPNATAKTPYQSKLNRTDAGFLIDFNTGKLERLLGWKPSLGIEAGIARTLSELSHPGA